MKCKRPMAHRPKMEGVINCKACEREEKERKEREEWIKSYIKHMPRYRWMTDR